MIFRSLAGTVRSAWAVRRVQAMRVVLLLLLPQRAALLALTLRPIPLGVAVAAVAVGAVPPLPAAQTVETGALLAAVVVAAVWGLALAEPTRVVMAELADAV